MYDMVYTILARTNNEKGGGQMEAYCITGNCASGCGSEQRRFLTREEKIEMLQEYKQELELEAKGVGERIAELEKQA